MDTSIINLLLDIESKSLIKGKLRLQDAAALKCLVNTAQEVTTNFYISSQVWGEVLQTTNSERRQLLDNKVRSLFLKDD